MANTVVINVLAKVQGLNEVEKFKSKLNSLTTTKGFKNAVMGVGVGAGMAAFNALGSAIGGAADYMADAVSKASNLAESTNKMQTVFGQSASVIEEFGKTSAAAWGLSKNAAYEATATFGNLFLSIGMGQKTAADMSLAVTKLAADLASFNNVDMETALGAIRSGLVGESEPMRQFGVLMNEAAVKAKGLEMGIAGAKGEMTDAAKVQARYALILEQSGTAQGDFAKTSDGLANTQRILQAQMEDLSAAIGTEMLPVMVKFANVLKDDVIPNVGILGDGLDILMRGIGIMTNPLGEATRDFERLKAQGLEATTRAAAEGAQAWDTYAEKAAGAREATRGIGAGTAAAMAPIIASASQARDALRSVTDAFKDVSRSQRDSLISTAYDAKRLPEEQILAQSELSSAQKAYRKGETEDGKRFTREQKAEAKIRVYNAAEAVNELNRKSTDLTADYGKTGVKLGEALMIPFHSTVYAWTLKINGLLRTVGSGFTTPTVTPRTVAPSTGPSLRYEPGETRSLPRGTNSGKTALSVTVNTRPTISVRDVDKATATRSRYTVTAGSVI